MSKYITTIGLEIHAELLTKSKVFCTCSAEFGGEPNSRCCPVCSGLPGTLPILNHTAVEYIIKAGYTMDCKISRFTKWDRKNYFYPDLPKAYQISQMPRPVCLNGYVDILVNGTPKRIRINRIHLEEDAGKLVHDERARVSLADYNRCGIPLIEIVTEPDFHSADDVTAFIEKIRLLLQYAEICDCKMEQGSMRCDVNISLAPEGAPLGTRAEIKNLNSVRAIGRAIEYEIYRQGALLDAGEKVIQETRRFNDASGETSTLRSKEDAHDYRYFPDPDIPPIIFTEEELDAIKASLPEMPEKRFERYTKQYGIAKNEADAIIASKPICDFFEGAVSVYDNAKAVSSFILVELMRRINLGEADMSTLKITGAMFGRLVEIGYTNKISKDKMRDVLRVMLDTGKTADEVADEENLWIKEDLALVEKTIGDILAKNPQAVEQYKSGEQKVFGFLMGQASKALKGAAAPQVIKEMLECMLSGTQYVKQTAEEITAKIADEKQAKKQQTVKETVNTAPAAPAERSVLDSIKGSSDTNRKKDVMFMPNRYRDHNTSMISEAEIGKTIRVSGWVENIRDHGGIKFIDLRDHYGVVQITMQQNEALLDGVNKECAISVEGKLVKRAEDTFNDKIATGTVELVAQKLDILGKVTTPLPFEVPSSKDSGEDIRLKYRFLDMRNKKVHDNIVFRSKVLSFMRERMTEMNFLELQTPILSTSSPEGARDYLIPSRKHHGKFYALPQAPQIFKQLYMVSGFDRYFQLAPCFRDEDARADRTPGEFYQLDMEMSFATQEDVFAVAENVFPAIIEKFTDKPFTKGPFPRITFDEAMLKYGSDKPDLRNPLFIIELSDLFVNSDFKPFANKTVRGIRVPKMAEKSKSFFENMEKFALSIGMKGLGYVKVDADGKYLGPIDKFLTDDAREEIRKRAELVTGDVLYFIADSKKNAEKFAGQIRTEVANRMELIKNDRFEICWIVDFPMYEEDEETGKPIFTHNPFSMPQGELEALNTKNPCDVLAYQYDVVCNGVELASGAVRNHDIDVMVKAFDIAGYTEADVAAKFGALYSAFKFGAPPHAGMAFGIDRMIMLLLDEESIREVIAFPLNSNAQDLLLGAPTEVTEQQLRDVHIKVRTRPQDVKTEQN